MQYRTEMPIQWRSYEKIIITLAEAPANSSDRFLENFLTCSNLLVPCKHVIGAKTFWGLNPKLEWNAGNFVCVREFSGGGAETMQQQGQNSCGKNLLEEFAEKFTGNSPQICQTKTNSTQTRSAEPRDQTLGSKSKASPERSLNLCYWTGPDDASSRTFEHKRENRIQECASCLWTNLSGTGHGHLGDGGGQPDSLVAPNELQKGTQVCSLSSIESIEALVRQVLWVSGAIPPSFQRSTPSDMQVSEKRAPRDFS